MEIKTNFLKALGLLEVRIRYKNGVMIISMDTTTKNKKVEYYGSPNGKGWVDFHRLKYQGFNAVFHKPPF